MDISSRPAQRNKKFNSSVLKGWRISLTKQHATGNSRSSRVWLCADERYFPKSDSPKIIAHLTSLAILSMKNRRAMGLLNPMRDKNGRQEPGRRRDDTCYHGLSSRLESRSVCNIYTYIYIYIQTTSAVSSTNLGSIVIFASFVLHRSPVFI